MSGRRCEGTTAAGNQCRRNAVVGELYCSMHSEERAQEVATQKADVVEALRTTFGYAPAAAAAGISHVTLKWWRDEDPEFAAECDAARAACMDYVEAAVGRRARGFEHTEQTRELRQVGTEDDGTPIFRMMVTREVTKYHYSDKAAELLLRGERAQYRNSYLPPVTDDRHEGRVESAARRIFEDPELVDQIEDVFTALDQL